jgi:hypothetical protein
VKSAPVARNVARYSVPGSAADLRAIRKTLFEKNVRIDDLQFLISENGEALSLTRSV